MYVKNINLTSPSDTHKAFTIPRTINAGDHEWFIFLKPLDIGDHTLFYNVRLTHVGSSYLTGNTVCVFSLEKRYAYKRKFKRNDINITNNNNSGTKP